MAQVDFSVKKNDDGSVTSTSTFDAKKINLPALIAAIQAAIPVIHAAIPVVLAIVSALGNSSVPPAERNVNSGVDIP